jgi:transcriptional regulator GlxA family with amidase domain
VDQNEQGVALEAAHYLDHLMSGNVSEVKTIVVNSGEVVALESTNTVALEDREVAQAVEFIRAHIGEPINIKDVTQRFSIARRTLERHFRATMGISLHEFLTRERVERAKDLLRATPALTLKEVARRCGFAGAKRLNLVFRRVAGISSAVWRDSTSSH